MRRALSVLAFLLLTASRAPAAPGVTRLWFDARNPHARPLVRARVGGVAQALLVDTGSVHHVLGRARARAARLPLVEGPPLYDFTGRPRATSRTRVQVLLDGLGPLPDQEIVVSEWADLLDSTAPGGPHADGVISPAELAGEGEAIVMDLAAEELRRTTWAEARLLLGRGRRPVADVERSPDGHFVLPVDLGPEHLRFVVDTGAPHSLLYAPRGEEVPEDAVRRFSRRARLRFGGQAREVALEVLEPIDAPVGFDGLLGLDALADCALALDRHRLALACGGDEVAEGASDSAIPAAARPPGASRTLCFTTDPVCLEERVDGSLAYHGDRIVAELRPDGSFRISPRGGPRSLAMRSVHDETERLLGATMLARYQRRLTRDLDRSFDHLEHALVRLWADETLPAEERRALLFALWNEAAEPGDRELGRAGARARAAIERFVRQALPRGSAFAFGDEELRRLNATRREGPRFAPYAPKADVVR